MRISDWSSDVCSSDLVAREIFSRRNDHRIAPALVEIGFAALGDHGSLQGPERIGVGEIAVVAEQVGDDREAARIGVEQRDRKSVVSGKSVSVRVDLGGRRNIKQKKKI